MFSSEEKKVFRKTPVGSRSGSAERKYDETQDKASTNDVNKLRSKGILKVKNEKKPPEKPNPTLKPLQTSNKTKLSPILNNETIVINEMDKKDSDTALTNPPAKKTYKKNKKNLPVKPSIMITSGVESVAPVHGENAPVTVPDLSLNTTSSVMSSDTLQQTKKTYKKIKKTKLPRESQCSISEEAADRTAATSLSAAKSITSSSNSCTIEVDTSMSPVAPAKRSYKKQKGSLQDGTNISVPPLATPYNTTIDSIA